MWTRVLGDIGFKFGAILGLVFAKVTFLVLLAAAAIAQLVALWPEPRVLGPVDDGATQDLPQVQGPRAQGSRTGACGLVVETRKYVRLRKVRKRLPPVSLPY